jgi:hypothetical protein
MNLPAFTAAASLYKAKVQYHAANSREDARGIVHPAKFAIRTPFSPSLPTTVSRRLPPWHKDVVEPLCRVITVEEVRDPATGAVVAAVCEKVCSDGSVLPWPCQ